MRYKAVHTCVLAVDLQEKLIPAMHDHSKIVKNAATLLKGARALEVPIILLRQYPKGLGDIVPDIRDAAGEYDPHDKLSFSGGGEPAVLKAIADTGKRNVLICGVEAHVCVLQSAIDLIERDYNVALVCDAIGSRKEYDKEIALSRASQEGAALTTTEAILFEMTERAGTDVFKIISSLVK